MVALKGVISVLCEAYCSNPEKCPAELRLYINNHQGKDRFLITKWASENDEAAWCWYDKQEQASRVK